MTPRLATRVAFCALWLAAGLVRADIESQMQQEAAALQPVLQEVGQLLVAGQVDQADQKILGTFLLLTRQAGKPLEPALVNGVKAEYSHFSAGSPLLSRPGAATLRAYFAELSKIQ